jgi:hypothetical protein
MPDQDAKQGSVVSTFFWLLFRFLSLPICAVVAVDAFRSGEIGLGIVCSLLALAAVFYLVDMFRAIPKMYDR